MRSKTIITIVVCAVVLLAVGTMVLVKKVVREHRAIIRAARIAEWQADMTVWRTNQWPQEREEEVARIKGRQQVDETTNAVTINLHPYINAKLTDAPSCWKGNADNNLSELPVGRSIYAGVPFDVLGMIQLTGGWLKNHYHKKYPVEVDNIRIERTCTKIHLLRRVFPVRAQGVHV